MLAQANPFAFGPEPTPAPTNAAAPNPFDAPAGAAPIGRATLDTLAPAANTINNAANNLQQLGDAARQTARDLTQPAPMPAVIPRGGVQPIPTQLNAGNMPQVTAAGGIKQTAGIEEVPDPFELDLPPVDAAPAPALEQPMTAQPAPAPAPIANDPFSLDLDPIPATREPIQSASAAADPTPMVRQPEPSFDLAPMPAETASAPSPFSVQPEPASAAQPFSREGVPTLSTGDFIGDATIDHDVARGSVRPEIQMSKIAPERAVLGEPLIYEIQLANVGQAVARNVIIEDRIPRGAKLMGTIPQAEMPDGSKRLIWRFETLRPGDTKSVKIRVEPITSGQIGSIATVRFVAEAAAETHIAAPELKFQLIGQNEAAIGETATYQFQIANNGDDDARDVMVRCLVPQGLQSPNREPDLEYPVGLLAAGETKTVDLPLAAIAEGEYRTEATLEARGISPLESASRIRIIKSRLSLDRTGPGKRFVGSKVKFTNQVTNNSSKTLTNVRITEELPPNVRFVAASDNGGIKAPGKVGWALATLAPGETRDLSITFVPEEAGEKASTINAVAADGSNTAIRAKMAVIGFAALKIENDRVVRPYVVGEQVSMRMVIKNGGTAPARAVGMSITVPDELQFEKVDGPVQPMLAGNVITFRPIDQIANGQDVAFDIVFNTIRPGDARLSIQLQSADLDKSLIQEESIRVVGNE